MSEITRRNFIKMTSAGAAWLALAGPINAKTEETEDERNLRWIIENLKQFNELVQGYDKKEDILKSHAYFRALTKQSLMKTILTYIPETSSIYENYEQIKNEKDINTETLLNKIFKDYFSVHEKYFDVGWKYVRGNHLLNIKLYEFVSEELTKKYNIKEPVDFSENIFGHDIGVKTTFLGKRIIKKDEDIKSESLGWLELEGIYINTERLDYKIEKEYEKYFNPLGPVSLVSIVEGKAWEGLRNLSPEKAKSVRGERIIKSTQYHEATHKLLLNILGNFELTSSTNDKETEKQNEYFRFRRNHNEAVAYLSELIYGEDKHSKLISIASLTGSDELAFGGIGDIILGGFEEYFKKNPQKFKNHKSIIMTTGSKKYKLPEVPKLKDYQITEIANSIINDLYRKPAIKGQPHYETRKVYNPVFKN
ncbi:twin-arginine translocation signal domain-containing protein [Candidatus Woesearchaeota archaeon]|nr:twin-arginine translocation signal domain-containing protein [Candidatus Woesearchaeota archaeon]